MIDKQFQAFFNPMLKLNCVFSYARLNTKGGVGPFATQAG